MENVHTAAWLVFLGVLVIMSVLARTRVLGNVALAGFLLGVLATTSAFIALQ
jgi:hypothetical protein